ncbi:family with sequence similarity 167, member Ab [Elysia marginata]|uniref:Family with sequence similarity 167, member Ab n=1 Tax=Elysia marginata TaxID=1093978 RepID=A0AAV4IAV5_9GAST|nr:family with sequence similarity 167, member Ab [Elysia marginata]
MATAAQNPLIVPVQTPAGKASVLTGDCDLDDPTPSRSPHPNRPLSIISESDPNSSASCETLSGKGRNSESAHNSPNRASPSMPGQSGGAAVVPGKVSSPRRTQSATARCSPAIRKLTENFERSPRSSPSRAGARAATRPASTGTIGVRSSKTGSSSSTNNSNSNVSTGSPSSMNNGTRSGTSSPRTSSPRTVVNKPTASSLAKTNRPSPSPSPATRAVSSSSATARTSSPSQNNRAGAGTGRKPPQQQIDPGSRQTAGKGVVASKTDKKQPSQGTKPTAKSSSTEVKNTNVRSLHKSERTQKVRQPAKISDSVGHSKEPSDNGESRLDDRGTEESIGVLASDAETSEKSNAIDNSPSSPPPQLLGSLSSGGDSKSNSIPRDGGGLARIRETAERLKLTSPSCTITSSPSQSPKFGHRVRFATSSASSPMKLMVTGSQSPPVSRAGFGRRGSPSSSSIPHITVTYSDGSVRGPPPQLGPLIPANINPATSYPLSPSPLSAISETDGQSSTQDQENGTNNANNYKSGSLNTNEGILSQPVLNMHQDVSNNNVKSSTPYNSLSTNTNYHNNINSTDHMNRTNYPRPALLHGSRSPTSTHPHTASALLPHYKLSSSAFFARRLSSGGSSIYEEEEEHEEMGNGEESRVEIKVKDDETNNQSGRGGGGGGGEGVKTSSTSSSSVLLSERGSSVSSLGSNTSINSNSAEPTSPPLPQPPSVLQQISSSHLTQLKETADKLRLATRRDSTMAWRQKYLESSGHMRSVSVANGELAVRDDGKLTEDRKQRIDAALDWLREELQDMRKDQNLARQLLTIRHDIYQLKLQRSTEEHQELIDDYWNELEELQELSDVLDLPQPVYGGDNPLRNVGVTRLNLCARRFSAC